MHRPHAWWGVARCNHTWDISSLKPVACACHAMPWHTARIPVRLPACNVLSPEHGPRRATLGWLHAQTRGFVMAVSTGQRDGLSPRLVVGSSSRHACMAHIVNCCVSLTCHPAVRLLLPNVTPQNNVKVPQEIQSFITGATFSTLVSECVFISEGVFYGSSWIMSTEQLVPVYGDHMLSLEPTPSRCCIPADCALLSSVTHSCSACDLCAFV